MIIRFKNGSYIKCVLGRECKRGKRGQKQIEKIRDYYLKYPDEFFEDFAGCKLLPYQKVVLRIIGRS